MTTFTQAPGGLESFAFPLADTNDYTIVTATNTIQYQLESLQAAADGSGTFQLWLDIGGGTEVNIVPAEAMTAGDIFPVKDHPILLKPGWALKCSASAGNVIDVTASLLKISRNANKQVGL